MAAAAWEARSITIEATTAHFEEQINQLTIELDRARAQQVPTRTRITRAAANAAAAKAAAAPPPADTSQTQEEDTSQLSEGSYSIPPPRHSAAERC